MLAGCLAWPRHSSMPARARLLVSHWSVPSQATVKLVTGAFEELKKDPSIGRAEALRRAEMAMLDPKTRLSTLILPIGHPSSSPEKEASEDKRPQDEAYCARSSSLSVGFVSFMRSANGSNSAAHAWRLAHSSGSHFSSTCSLPRRSPN